MTRYARSGNTQQHKKMPSDPTPWSEFSSQPKKKCVKHMHNRSTSVSNIVSKSNDDYNNYSFTGSEGKRVEKSKIVDDLTASRQETGILTSTEKHTNSEIEDVSTNANENSQKTHVSIKQKKKKNKHKLEKRNIDTASHHIIMYANPSVETNKNWLSDELVESKTRKKEKLQIKESVSSAVDASFEKFEKVKCVTAKSKKLAYRKRLLEKRKKNGITLLSDKAESRIYKLKKSLRRKGETSEAIQLIVRQARRSEEFEYRKTLKTCFNCRKVGHVLSDCPKIQADNEQGTGICFKCGSTEHSSFRCSIKTPSFAFAKCFVCKQQGHLSRNCPQNEHGVYPKGGKCNFCGAIDHKKQECPKLNKKGTEKEVLRAHMIGKSTSVDEEVINRSCSISIAQKKPKVVKF